MSDTPKTRPEELAPYLRCAWQLMPLHRWDAVNPKTDRILGKAPRDNDWTNKTYDNSTVLSRAGDRNTGVRLKSHQAVLDFDPKNYPRVDPKTGERVPGLTIRKNPEKFPGSDGWQVVDMKAELVAATKINLESMPHVITGSGGDHYYLTKDPNVSLRMTLKGFEGIELKSKGHQVVAAGSIHPNGQLYHWDDFGVPLDDVPPAPPELIELFRRPEPGTKQGDSQGGQVTAEQLGEILNVLPVTEYREYDRWLSMAMASHHATGGDHAAMEVFLEWSAGDPAFVGARNENAKKWDGFSDSKGGAEVTVGTLYLELIEAGHADLIPARDAAGDFDELPPEDSAAVGDKPGKPLRFLRGKEGILANSQRNIVVALAKMDIALSYDLFADRLLISEEGGKSEYLNDSTLTRIWLSIDKRFLFRPNKELFWDVATTHAREHSFHPVRDYLAGLEWDGVARLDSWLVDYASAADTPYTRAVGALTLVAAVRRVRWPGCKFDEMAVLESAQGKLKSSALRTLAVRDDWFTDTLHLTSDGKQAIEQLSGKWIVEAGELQGMRKGEVDQLKAFLSRQTDRARLAYGRIPTEVPRQCVIFGTTNSKQYLKDGTGNRRFWPIDVGVFDVAGLRRDRDQLWAEAAAREAANESIRLPKELWEEAGEQQAEREVEDPFVRVIGEVLEDLPGKIRSTDIWNILNIPVGVRTQEHNVRLGAAMRKLGFEYKAARYDGKLIRGYVRGTALERQKNHIYLHGGPGSWVASLKPADEDDLDFLS